MIEVSHVSKEFVSLKKYPGLKGAIKGLFSNEKVRKTAADDANNTLSVSFDKTRMNVSDVIENVMKETELNFKSSWWSNL